MSKSSKSSSKGKGKETFEDRVKEAIRNYADEKGYNVEEALEVLDMFKLGEYQENQNTINGILETVDKVMNPEVAPQGAIDTFLNRADIFARLIRYLRTFANSKSTAKESFRKRVEELVGYLPPDSLEGADETQYKEDAKNFVDKFLLVNLSGAPFSSNVASLAKELLRLAKLLDATNPLGAVDSVNLLGTLDVHIFTHKPEYTQKALETKKEKQARGEYFDSDLVHFSIIAVGNTPKASLLKGWSPKQVKFAKQIHLVYYCTSDTLELKRQSNAVLQLQKAVDRADELFTKSISSKDKDRAGFAYGAKVGKESVIVSNDTLHAVKEIIHRYHQNNAHKLVVAVRTRKIKSTDPLYEHEKKVVVGRNLPINGPVIYTNAVVKWLSGIKDVSGVVSAELEQVFGPDVYKAIRDTVFAIVNERHVLDKDKPLPEVLPTLYEMGFALARTLPALAKIALYEGQENTNAFEKSANRFHFVATKGLASLLGAKVRYNKVVKDGKEVFTKGDPTNVVEVSKNYANIKNDTNIKKEKKVTNQSVRMYNGEVQGLSPDNMSAADITTLFGILQYRNKFDGKDILKSEKSMKELAKVNSGNSDEVVGDGNVTVEQIREALKQEYEAIKDITKEAKRIDDAYKSDFLKLIKQPKEESEEESEEEQ